MTVKSTYIIILFMENSRKHKFNYNDQKQMSGCLRAEQNRGRRVWVTKSHEGTFGGDGYIYYLYCCDLYLQPFKMCGL